MRPPVIRRRFSLAAMAALGSVVAQLSAALSNAPISARTVEDAVVSQDLNQEQPSTDQNPQQ